MGTAKYRQRLPQLGADRFLTDAGLETTLIFLRGLDLPEFAAYDLLKDPVKRAIMRAIFAEYLGVARDQGLGMVVETPTWRASQHWGRKLGYDSEALATANREAVDFLLDLREEFETPDTPVVISGCLGPLDDGYFGDHHVTAEEAQQYHQEQIKTFRHTAADMVCALTMGTVAEATGVTRAAQAADMPVAISFTLETDARLPSGIELGEAIAQVDEATGSGPLYYMVNCAHPDHFSRLLADLSSEVRERLRGLRCNASRKSHAELDESTELDRGHPAELGEAYAKIIAAWPQLRVLGGCCGTDTEHLEAIAQACVR